MLDLFDILQDKSNEPYFTNEEKLILLNSAQNTFLSEYMENNFPGGIGITERGFISARSIENTLGNSDILKPLIVANMQEINGSGDKLMTNSNGRVSETDINTAITHNSGSSTPVLKLLSLALVSGGGSTLSSVKYNRHNDLFKSINNGFLTPTTTEPIYVIDGNGYIVYPNAVHELDMSVLRYPVDMVFVSEGSGSNVDCELDEQVHERILAIALEMVGISTREVFLDRIREKINHQDRV